MPSVAAAHIPGAHVGRALAGQGLQVHAQGLPPSFFQKYLLARYSFNGTPADYLKKAPDFQLNNTNYFQNAALNVNGIYDLKPNGYEATVGAPALSYDSFTVAITYKAGTPPMYFKNNGQLAKSEMPLLVGGTGYRWLSVYFAGNGNLSIRLNNNTTEYQGPATLKPPLGKWSTLVCGVDVPSHSLTAYVNGKKVIDVQLPQGFAFDVASSPSKEFDKEWTFQDYSNAQAYHGLIGDLSYFSAKLPNDAMKQLSAVIKP